MNKPHVHKDVMIHFANGGIVQGRNGEDWVDLKLPTFNPCFEYRIKPESEYPVTSLTEQQCRELYYHGSEDSAISATRLANAAIKQHIIDTEGK